MEKHTIIKLTEAEFNILQDSNDFNIICILTQSLTNNETLQLSNEHVNLLYDYCVDNTNTILHNLAIKVLKADRNNIKQINFKHV